MSNASLYECLREHVRQHNVRHYLEIGTRDGDSLRVVLEEDAGTLESVWLADTWGSEYGGTGRGNHRHIDQLLDDFNFDGRRAYLDGNSRDTIPALYPEKLNTFDLVLVDGDHSYDGAITDLNNVWPLARWGGAIVFHDICHPAHPDLRKCFDDFVDQYLAPSKVIEEGYGVGIVWKR
jgi:hypothetical protein